MATVIMYILKKFGGLVAHDNYGLLSKFNHLRYEKK